MTPLRPIYIPRRYPRKLFLPQGMISLVILPFLIFWYTQHNHSFEKPVTMDVNWWDPGFFTHLSKAHSPIYRLTPYLDRQYLHIRLTGNESEDKTRLDFAQLEIRRLANSPDTINGIHIHFGEQAKYWMLVRALDLCQIEGAQEYVPDQNDLWIFNPAPRKPSAIAEVPFVPFCDTSYQIWKSELFRSQSIDKTALEKQKRITFWLKTARELWPLEVLFVCLVGLAIYRSRLSLKMVGTGVKR